MPKIARVPDCHPERRHKGLGKCGPCYNLERNREYQLKNSEIISARRAKDRAENKVKYSDYRTRLKYGMSSADIVAVLESQDWKCKLCGTDINMDSRHVDHNHSTGVVRGLLCGECNLGLGKFKDNPEVLRRAADYLERSTTGFKSERVK